MGNLDELTLEEIDARLEELREKKDRAAAFRDLVGETSDNLTEIADYEFVDGDMAAQIDLLQTMLDWVIHHGVHVEKGIQYEREQLRRRKWELEREQELAEADDA